MHGVGTPIQLTGHDAELIPMNSRHIGVASGSRLSLSGVAAETTHGVVLGLRDDFSGVCTFKGIPYARPPVGELRWRAPQPARPWQTPLDARRFGAAGPQPVDFGGDVDELADDPDAARADGWLGSEDCLSINVWTRFSPGVRRPVMVWIHGGANWLEGSRSSVYDGQPLAQRNDLVVFSLNYRLGIFGFLDVSVLGGPDYAGSHSLGLRDQQLAIEWIHANAAAFGGDPDNITLVGESAGSMDISWHLATGLLPTAIRRVALMSGIAGVPGVATNGDQSFYSEEEGQRIARDLLAAMKIFTMSELILASTRELMQGLLAVVPSRDMLFDLDGIFYPRVDPRFTPRTPFEHVLSGRARDVEMLIGTTSHEINLWLAWDDTLDSRSPVELAQRLPGIPEQLAAEMVEHHKAWCAPSDHGGPGLQLLSDAMFVMPSLLIAEAHAKLGGKTFVYRFCRELADPRLGAAHASDLAYFLGTWRGEAAERFYGKAADAIEESARATIGTFMMDSLAAFVRTGSPDLGAGAAANWPEYCLPNRPTMRLDDMPCIESDPLSARRRWWMERVYKQAPEP